MSDEFGADTKTEYYNNGTIRATIDAEKHRTEYKYDENNRRTEITKTVNGVKFTEKVVYDEVGNIRSSTDGENHTNTYVYDDGNRRIKSTDLLNHSTLTAYDKVGNITQTTDELGRITKTEYDVLNRQKSVTQALGTVDVTTMAYGYDAVGNIISETDGRNHTTTYTPDALNRRIKTTDVYNDITQTEYYETPGLVAAAILLELPNANIDLNSIGKIVKTTDVNGYSTRSIYDRIGRLTDTYDGTKHRTSHITYYADDRIKTSTDTFGKVTTYVYNDALRQTLVTDPLGLTTTRTYDQVGNLLAETDSRSRTTQYDYDELNRQKTITDAEGGITSYTYYNDGKTKSIKDAANNTTSYTYDAANRLTKEQSVLGTRTYGYDEVDNQTSTVDRNGRTINYDYDNLNRVKSESWLTLPNTKLFTYTYDQNSNLTSADDGSIKYNYTYDNTDLLSQIDRITTGSSTVSFKYDYDAVGNLTKSDELIGTTLTASTSYKYNDPRNLNTEITQTGVGLVSKLVKFDYDAAGLNTQIQRYANGQLAVTTTDSYDEFGRLVGIKQENSTGVIANSSYGFDNLNRLTSETIDGVSRQIDYDKTDQVKSVTGSNSEAYTYDLNGNRTLGGYITGVGNKLLSDGTHNYDYDAEGNRTKRTNIATTVVDEYVWDYRNRLTTVVSKDAGGTVTQTVGYEYDVDDQRVSKTVNTSATLSAGGVVEKYILDRNQIAFVTDASGTETFHYLYGLNIDSVMAQDSPTGMVWSLGDRLGNISLLADAGGAVVDKRTYDSFGNLLTQTNPGVDFRYGYTGRELDQETGLHYYRARYYDAGNGRFISVDPMGFGAGDTNLYRYVGNSSTLATDPTGMWINFAAGAAIGGGLDLGVQLWQNGGDFSKVNWGSVGVSAATGAIGGGIGSFLSNQGVGLAARTAITAGAEFNLGYWGKVTENGITGKGDLFDGALLSGAIGGVSGAGGELLQAGAGAAWGKYGDSITAGAKNLDQWGGKTAQQFGRAIDNSLDFLSGSKLQPAFAAVGDGLDGSLARPLSQQVGDGFQHVMAMAGDINIWRQQNIWPQLPTASLDHPNLTAADFGVALRDVDLNNPNVFEQAYDLGSKVRAIYNRIQSKEMRTVLAGVSYRDSNGNAITKFAQNDERFGNSFIHPLFAERIQKYTTEAGRKFVKGGNILGQGEPGTHAEVIAASKVLRRIEMMNPGLKITAENADEYLSRMMIYNVGLKAAGSSPGVSMARCSNCQFITADIPSLSDLHREAIYRLGLR